MLERSNGHVGLSSRRRRKAIATALGIGIAALVSTPASAQDDDYASPDRPGIADGSEVVGSKRFQIESGMQLELRNENGARDRTIYVPTLLRLGLTDRFEARIETNAYNWERVRDPATGVTRSRGGAPVSFGAKYQLLDRQGSAHPAVGVIGRIFPPSGSGDFRTDHWTGDFRVAADWDFAPKLSLNPNIGVAFDEDDEGRPYRAALLALTLSYNPTKQLGLFIDTGEQFPERKNGRSSAIVDAGIAYLPAKDLQLDLSAGTRVAGDTAPHPFVSAGISKRF